MTFRRCTVAYTSITSFKSSYEAGRTALPTFPCEHQQSANPYVAMVVFSCRGCLVFAYALDTGYANGD